MAITLRNKIVEEKIRRLGRRWGLGPSAVIARAVEQAEKAAPSTPSPEDLAQRRKALDEIVERARTRLTEEDRARMRQIEDDMYDENGLPK